MSTSSPVYSDSDSDWSTRGDFDWQSEEGLVRLRELLRAKLPYQPADFQVENTARLLMGKSVLCITATGDGKSALFYMYSLVRPGTVTIVVSPTNALESDMVNSLSKFQIPALAINSNTIDTVPSCCADGGRRLTIDLWAEAASGRYNVILTSPEMLKTDRFKAFVQSTAIRPRLALFCVDECHLVDEWGTDFRKAFGNIAETIPWLPDWTVRLALTATLEPGRQTNVIMKALGFRDGNFYLARRDCQRRNVELVFRTTQHAFSGDEFHDLDWLVPPNAEAATDMTKTLVYCETIELGHKVTRYLRTLLPQVLQQQKAIIIRHIHSLTCDDCKAESLDALYKSGEGLTTAIFVSTDVLGVGMDVQDCDRVVCFPTPSSSASLLQRTGRTSRGRERHGTAYVYIKKTDVEAVIAYLKTTPLDPRLLCPDNISQELVSTVQSQTQSANVETLSQSAPSKKVKSTPARILALIKSDAFIKNLSLWLIIAAHVRGLCVVRQINIIYGNPMVDHDCGYCSSCSHCSQHPPNLPSPAMDSSHVDAAPQPVGTAQQAALSAGCDTPQLEKLPGYLKLTVADVEKLTSKLEQAAIVMRREGPFQADRLFIGYRSFLPTTFISRITKDFFFVRSKDTLEERMTGWRYWDDYGDRLWIEVTRLADELRAEMEGRHEEVLERRRRKLDEKKADEVRAYLAAVNITSIKRVILHVATPSESGLVSSLDSEKENHVPMLGGPRHSTTPSTYADMHNDVPISMPSTSHKRTWHHEPPDIVKSSPKRLRMLLRIRR